MSFALNMDYTPKGKSERARTEQIEHLKAQVLSLQRTILALTDPAFDPAIHNEHANFTPSERRILCALFERKGKLVSNEGLFDALYGNIAPEFQPEDQIIKVMVCKIKKKLTHHDIHAVWGIGYKLVEKACNDG